MSTLPLLVPNVPASHPALNMQPGTWLRIPNSAAHRSGVGYVWPPGSNQGSAFMGGYTESGGTLDTDLWRFLTNSGGHGNYGGNETYAFDLLELKWYRLNNPWPHLGRTGLTQATGFYPMGATAPENAIPNEHQPMQGHWYDLTQYVPGKGVYLFGNAAAFPGVDPRKPFPYTLLFDIPTATWNKLNDGLSSNVGTVTAYHPVTGHIWLKGDYPNHYLVDYDPIADTHTPRSNQFYQYGYNCTATIDVKANLFVMVQGNIKYGTVGTLFPLPAFTFDLSIPAPTKIPQRGLSTVGLEPLINGVVSPGLDYDSARERVVAWNGGTTVYVLDSTTRTWAVHPADPANTDDPGDPHNTGTYKRWFYCAALDVFCLNTKQDQDWYLYKPFGAGVILPPPPPPPPPALPVVTLLFTGAPLNESGAQLGVVTVHRDGPTTAPLPVQYGVSGSATPGMDYAALSGSVVIPAGSADAVIEITVENDDKEEVQEKVQLTLVADPTYAVGAQNTVEVIILSDDVVILPPPPEISIEATVSEAYEAGAVWGVFTFTRTGNLDNDLTVQHQVAGSAVPDIDYQSNLVTAPVVFAAGVGTVLVHVVPLSTPLTGPGQRTVVVTLIAHPNYVISADEATVAIHDDAVPPSPPNTIFPSDFLAHFVFDTALNTYRADLSLPASPPPIDPPPPPPPPLPTVSIVATIPDAHESPLVHGLFTLSRTGAVDTALSVAYTLGGTATLGVDYDPNLTGTSGAPLLGLATIPVGETSIALRIMPFPDMFAEGPETVIITLTPLPSYLLSSDTEATVTIGDAPFVPVPTMPAVTIVASTAVAEETGRVQGQLTLTRTGDLTLPLAVSFSTGGTATIGVDYHANMQGIDGAPPGIATFLAGNATTTLRVWPYTDALTEAPETVIVTLAAQATYLVGMLDAATVLINDATVVVPPPPPPPPPPPSPTGALVARTWLNTPSLNDEKATYRDRWGMTWPVSLEPSVALLGNQDNYKVIDPDIHGVTEGPDLGHMLAMFKRTGLPGYAQRAAAWGRYYLEDYLQYKTTPGNLYYWLKFDAEAYGYDHVYGDDLLDYAAHIGDTRYLDVAEGLAALLETYYSNPKWVPGYRMSSYGPRGAARHLYFFTRLAEVTGKTRWLTLRDRLIALFLASPDWEEAQDWGMYFIADVSLNTVAALRAAYGANPYAVGIRSEGSWSIHLVVTAFIDAYRMTGNPELLRRALRMARYVSRFGINPLTGYAESGLTIDTRTNTYVSIKALEGLPANVQAGYATAMVNTLVWLYKFTGELAILAQAKDFFLSGTTHKTLAETRLLQSPGHFVDTWFNNYAHQELWFNGEGQYVYGLFENGGQPFLLI